MVMKRAGVVFILLLAFLGIADAAYLARHESAEIPLICNLESLSGCTVVAQSPYASFMGVPLSRYGVAFYSIVFVLALLELIVFDRLLRRVLQGVAIVGAAASLGFLFVQAFVIHALCAYCVASAVLAFLILLFSTLIEPVRARASEKTPPSAPPVFVG